MRVNPVNNSGFRPVGKAVLLRAFEMAEKKHMIHLPDEVEMSVATCDTQGIVVEIGPDCWQGEKETPRAKVGDKVLITRFSGGMLKGKDGFIYRMIPDHAIYAVKIEEEEESENILQRETQQAVR
jgi:co-chaperonin GroES (HSP10)